MTVPTARLCARGASFAHTSRRQAEPEAVAERLAGFSPTKILVEAPWGSVPAAGLDADFASYLAAECEARRDGVYQLGFRSAKALGHERLHGIDAADPVVAALSTDHPELGADVAFRKEI